MDGVNPRTEYYSDYAHLDQGHDDIRCFLVYVMELNLLIYTSESTAMLLAREEIQWLNEE
ncbi:hypothetical protein Ciccas_007726 [Cichlidogyrus casuarinus]|uniref:Uncharacterized protein n=1 Tax=Cichlidogyrus casuarinus TaxID=1844966 RepID=A0ABD2Q648_9PLAT